MPGELRPPLKTAARQSPRIRRSVESASVHSAEGRRGKKINMSTRKKTPKKTNARQLPDWEDGIQIGSLPKMLKNESPFSYGDEVMCLKEIDCLHKVQKCCGYRSSKIAKRKTFSDGDVVREIDHIEIVRKLQTDHGNWKEIPGQIGKVMQVHKDGDFPGQFQDKSSICNPAYLASCGSSQDENFMTPDTSTESKCEDTERNPISLKPWVGGPSASQACRTATSISPSHWPGFGGLMGSHVHPWKGHKLITLSLVFLKAFPRSFLVTAVELPNREGSVVPLHAVFLSFLFAWIFTTGSLGMSF